MHKYLVCALIMLSSPGYSQEAMLRGKVQDGGNGMSVSGAEVLIRDAGSGDSLARVRTDRQGLFELSVSGASIWSVSAYLDGYEAFDTLLVPPLPDFLAIDLYHRTIRLNEVIITSEKIPKPYAEASLPLAFSTSGQFENQAMLSLSHMMQLHPGLNLASDGMWGTSLNVRGLTEQRLLILVDGVRLETSPDLSAALSMIGIGDIERVEVIKGAASALYGSGAMGGVINIITRRSSYSDDFKFGGMASLGVHSVNMRKTQELGLFAGKKSWYTNLQLQYRRANDAQTPEGVIPNSGFNDFNIAAAGGFRPASGHEIVGNLQLFRGWDIGIPGGRVFPPNARSTFLRADRQLADLEYRLKRGLRGLDQVMIKYSYQAVQRDVEVIPGMPPVIRGERSTQVTQLLPSGDNYVHSIIAQSVWNPLKGHTVIAGLEFWSRRLVSMRSRWITNRVLDPEGNPVSETLVVRGERPVPESTFGSAGIFIQDEATLLENRLKLLIGLRSDWIRTANETSVDPEYLIINGEFNDNPPGQKIVYPAALYRNFAWAVNLGMEFNLSSTLSFTGNLARSFRAPSLEERYKYIDLGARVELGNADLQPEKGYFIDLGTRIQDGPLHLSGNVFWHRLNDLIALAPADSVAFDPVLPGDSNPLVPALRNTNIDKALLYGFDLTVDYDFSQAFSAYGRMAWVVGKNIGDGAPLPLIPPFNGRIGVKASLCKAVFFDLSAIYFSVQNRIAPGEMPTDGYVLFDFLVNSRTWNLRGLTLELFGGVENMFNSTYRNHLSSMRGAWQLEPGRNFFLRLKIGW